MNACTHLYFPVNNGGSLHVSCPRSAGTDLTAALCQFPESLCPCIRSVAVALILATKKSNLVCLPVKSLGRLVHGNIVNNPRFVVFMIVEVFQQRNKKGSAIIKMEE